MTATAKNIVGTVLGEAYTGPVATILKKYHLLDDNGELRNVTIGAEADKPGEEGPIIDPEVLERFLAVDRSKNKRVFDWMIYAAAGGTPHIRESERAIDLAKNWVIDNRMKGKDRNEKPIKPMTRKEAEEDWEKNELPIYYVSYFFADQDLAGDIQYPCFGWFRHWPGRNNIYPKVLDTVTKWLALANDKKFIQLWNRSNPKEPFQPTLWDGDKPIYESVEALADFVGSVKANLARRKAEQNVVTVGKNPEGGYRTGADEVLYDDENVKVIVPLTAAASLKKGFNDWCVSNRSRWDDYFKSRSQNALMWGSYTQRGPFAFMHLKKPTPHDKYLQSVALHVQLNNRIGAEDRIDFWDRQNNRVIRQQEIARRMEQAVPGSSDSLRKAVREVEDWLKDFKAEQLERYPALEALARALVNAILED